MPEADETDLKAVATAPGPKGGKPKDVKTVKVVVETACCYREYRFPPEDTRARCHLGLTKLDFAVCPNCIHFGARPPKSTKLLTGGEAMAVSALLQTLQETHNPETGARPEGALQLDAPAGEP